MIEHRFLRLKVSDSWSTYPRVFIRSVITHADHQNKLDDSFYCPFITKQLIIRAVSPQNQGEGSGFIVTGLGCPFAV